MTPPFFFNSIVQRLYPRWPLLIYATAWTTLLTVTVGVASFATELAFVSAITSKSAFSKVCQLEGSVRVPFDVPMEVFCLPARFFKRSDMDMVVPPLFAAVIVAASAYVVRAMALWEVDEEVN
ncbi:hypothetical protein LguiA_016214 [Lonicera macranthoides]